MALHTQSGVDTITKLCRDVGVTINPGDGALLITCDKSGVITAHCLQAGLLTEGRLEQNIGVIFRVLTEARARITNEAMRAAARARLAKQAEEQDHATV